MAKIDNSLLDIGYMDKLASGDSSLHRLDPRAKLITTLAFILVVVSFDKYAVSELIPFFIYPMVQIAVGSLPMNYLMKKVLLVAPFALLIGIFNPLMDRETLIQIGSFHVSGGWVSLVSIMIRFVLTVTAALTLITLTGFNAVCMAMEKLGTPKPFVIQLMFLYRYIFVLIDEAARMVRARSLRSFDSNAMAFGLVAPLVGQLLFRALDRAQRIHLSMCCRGFEGRFRTLGPMTIGLKEYGYVVGWSSFFIFLRFYNLPVKLGEIVTSIF